MKKVAIMTWYTHRNYGTALQACAISHIIEKLGYTPELIQYLPKRGVYKYDREYFYRRCLTKINSKLHPIYKSEERELLYEKFIDERTFQTERCNCYAELHDLNDKFDAFVCGSDQIWSPLNHDEKYFLSFVDNENKMIAYAPSMGVNEIKDLEIRTRMKKYIERFVYLSVREQKGADIVKELTGREVEVVLDPTLLLDKNEWEKFARIEEAKKLEEKYIICYFLGNSKKYMAYVRALSRKLNMPYYVIPISKNQKEENNAVPFEVGPCEFVSLIRNAKYVCTDSFHGIAFAANYNIPFSVFKRFKDNEVVSQNSRVYSFLNMLKLEDRLIDYRATDISENISDCDFLTANGLLEKKRKASISFLREALNNAVEAKNKKEVEYKITETCCGCGACATVCSQKAIEIKKDSEGFEHYFIDQEKCVSCGMCKKVCPMTNITAMNEKKAIGLYAIKSHSTEVLKKSSSGGVGHTLAKLYFENGYAVCGCAYNKENNEAKHIWINDENELHLLQGSKYIQSISRDALKQVKVLAEKQNILFFGTPCQAAGVDKILRSIGLRHKALIVDLICHGVPSYHLWDKYLAGIKEKYKMYTNPNAIFRDKSSQNRQLKMCISGNGHTYRGPEHKDDFYAFFAPGLCYMESCYECPYREKSAADIRIGDYWGKRYEDEDYGISMVICNTPEGVDAIKKIEKKGECRITKHDLEEYWTVQSTTNPPKVLIREKLIEAFKDPSTDIRSIRREYCFYHDLEREIFRSVHRLKK